MGKRVRLHPLTGIALQRVIADLPGGIHRLHQIATLQTIKPGIGGLRPDAGQTIGLQFDAHRQGVAFLLADLRALAVDLIEDPQRILHMMGHFMRHHIGGGKIAPSAQLIFHRHKEIGVQKHLAFGWAIERAGGRTGAPAGRLGLALEQDQDRWGVLLLQLGAKNLGPDLFGIGQSTDTNSPAC